MYGGPVVRALCAVTAMRVKNHSKSLSEQEKVNTFTLAPYSWPCHSAVPYHTLGTQHFKPTHASGARSGGANQALSIIGKYFWSRTFFAGILGKRSAIKADQKRGSPL